MSASGGAWKALGRAVAIGADICQIFVKNNMQWFGRPCPAADLEQFHGCSAKGQLACVFGHTGYLINLGAAPSPNRDKSIQSLLQEVQFASDLGLPFLVLHPGAHLGAGEDAGLTRVVDGLNEVFTATRRSKVRIALENTAGQGTCLGAKIEHLAEIFARVQTPERLGICLDTAHFFAAGYDIRTSAGWEKTMAAVERLVGLDQVLAFHLNDSKTDLASRVDRHAHIGQGKLGLEAFRAVLNDARFAHLPGCLETPKSDDLHEDIENLRVLRSLLEPKAPPKKPKSAQGRQKRTRGKTSLRPTSRRSQ